MKMEKTKVRLTIRSVDTGKIDFSGYVTKESVQKGIEEMFKYDTYKRYTLTFQRE